MKNTILLLGFLLSFGVGVNALADAKDGVKALPENVEATDAQKEAVRQGAKNACEDLEDDDKREQCVADYFANHNLDEEPSCD